MSHKKELWIALSALAAAVPAADAGTEAGRAGVAATVNPAVEGKLGSTKARVLFVGSDVFRDETIRTDVAGLTHLLFLDQSSLTIGPNSELVIDRFVFDPETSLGELSLSATKGVLRFVGGSLSKSGKISVNTPLGTLGIRGGVALVESKGLEGDTTACLIYGESLKGTHAISGASGAVTEHERCLRLTTGGAVEEFGPIDPDWLESKLAALQGPDDGERQTGRQVPLPADFSGWLRELAGVYARDDGRR
ncbi:MAG: hypothetical protein GY953_27920, partial [bacterium]|nr:hypothetical protein [bacterium]